jgi:cyclohexanone monooxygenase
VLTNMLPSIEQHVDFIADCLEALRAKGKTVIEPVPEAQEEWVGHVGDVSNITLRSTCSSWYVGANIPGKPRVFMPYIGGLPAYIQACEKVVANGYEGFALA